MKIKALRNSVLLLAALLFLSACNTSFQDYTAERIPQNPSGIYTFSFTAELPRSNRVEGSERAEIVINGETHPMILTNDEDWTFSYDYKMPPGVSEARYYYIVYWDHHSLQGVKTASRYSTAENKKVYHARLINRYPIQMVHDRGPAGSRIPVVGSGFTPQDIIVIGGNEATTTVHSSNSIEFNVPALPAGRTYRVVLQTGQGDLPVGNFKIDEAVLNIQPQELYLASGGMDFLIVELDNPAPIGGLYIDAQTDVPDSLIMPEIIVPEGARSVNVNVTGGSPGFGVLVLTVPGYGPIEIPVTVE